jgi:hypothetical protein
MALNTMGVHMNTILGVWQESSERGGPTAHGCRFAYCSGGCLGALLGYPHGGPVAGVIGAAIGGVVLGVPGSLLIRSSGTR